MQCEGAGAGKYSLGHCGAEWAEDQEGQSHGRGSMPKRRQRLKRNRSLLSLRRGFAFRLNRHSQRRIRLRTGGKQKKILGIERASSAWGTGAEGARAGPRQSSGLRVTDARVFRRALVPRLVGQCSGSDNLSKPAPFE
ncbi:unnamed protein product [Leptosia nina]|uniref:Uncharacterized protein n=1 Tax=Leptosia nina TaxID=320188 RepID=A0AAV1IZ38_9NEOP